MKAKEIFELCGSIIRGGYYDYDVNGRTDDAELLLVNAWQDARQAIKNAVWGGKISFSTADRIADYYDLKM